MIRLALMIPLLAMACGDAPDETIVTQIPGREVVVETPEYTEVIDTRPETLVTYTFGTLCDMDPGGGCQEIQMREGDETVTALAGWERIGQTEQALCNGGINQCDPCAEGVGCTAVPDNGAHTYCHGVQPSNSDFDDFHPGASYAMWWLRNHPVDDGLNRAGLPSGYTLDWRGPWAGQPNNCAGTRPCSSATGSCWYDPGPAFPTKTDAIFAKRDLSNTPDELCGLPRCPGPSCLQPGNHRWLACTKIVGSATQLTWNNGFGTFGYTRGHGGNIQIDDAAIQIRANNPFDGISTAAAATSLYVHVTCHELGHTLGLTHYGQTVTHSEPIGASGAEDNWQNSCMSSIQPNPIGTVPWFSHDTDTIGLRQTYQQTTANVGAPTYPKHTFSPPRGTTEL